MDFLGWQRGLIYNNLIVDFFSFCNSTGLYIALDLPLGINFLRQYDLQYQEVLDVVLQSLDYLGLNSA